MVTTLPAAGELAATARETAKRCGVDVDALGGAVTTTSPINGAPLATVDWVEATAVDAAVARAREAFLAWRAVPAPVRGALVKRLGELLTEHKSDLATLISLEVGKITSEALGEVQEMIDICDFAVGLSRQLYGRTISSERPGHRLMETWHPLGVVGVISAFNFPAAVWSWNTAIALVCGDPVVWKPSELAPLTALACAALLDRAAAERGAPAYLSQVLIGGPGVGEALVERLADAYARLPIGNPLAPGTLVGPLINERAYAAMRDALDAALEQGGTLVAGGGRRLADQAPDAYYAEPALVRMPEQTPIVTRETFAPILYVMPYDTLEQAIALNNAVPQGLSSSIFTRDQAEAELFVSAEGSDCGIVNVNIGTSGAEIGGAFGGEKETGGGRESGSDAWRAYMRRATNTINYSGELPLAQGVEFTV